MNLYTDEDRTIAFAGVYQAAALIHQIATQGQSDTAALSATIGSLFVENPPTTESVFGGVAGLKYGMQTLIAQMNSNEALGQTKNIQITQYVIGMLALEAKLRHDPEVEELVFKKLAVPQTQSLHFGLLHDNTLAGIALVYAETLSRLRPKIMIKGAHGHLTNHNNANRIRAILLSGIRAARLWRQVGGRRWHLLFRRGKYLHQVEQLLQKIRTEDHNSLLFK